MYLLAIRAIYGCIESALLWYNLFSAKVEGFGFEINPYVMCVTNKVTEGTQCTIAWYVNDNNLLHKNPEIITDIINEVKKKLESYML